MHISLAMSGFLLGRFSIVYYFFSPYFYTIFMIKSRYLMIKFALRRSIWISYCVSKPGQFLWTFSLRVLDITIVSAFVYISHLRFVEVTNTNFSRNFLSLWAFVFILVPNLYRIWISSSLCRATFPINQNKTSLFQHLVVGGYVAYLSCGDGDLLPKRPWIERKNTSSITIDRHFYLWYHLLHGNVAAWKLFQQWNFLAKPVHCFSFRSSSNLVKSISWRRCTDCG